MKRQPLRAGVGDETKSFISAVAMMISSPDVPYWESMSTRKCAVNVLQRTFDYLSGSGLPFVQFPADWFNVFEDVEAEGNVLDFGQRGGKPPKNKVDTGSTLSSMFMNYRRNTPDPDMNALMLTKGDWVVAMWPGEPAGYYDGVVDSVDRAGLTCKVIFDDGDVREKCPLSEVHLNPYKLKGAGLLKKLELLCGYKVETSTPRVLLVSLPLIIMTTLVIMLFL